MKNSSQTKGKFFQALQAAILASIFAAGTAQAESIGYYNLGNPANTNAASAITLAGHTPVLLNDLSAASLNGIDALWILNPSSGNYALPLTDNLANIDSYIQDGGTLLLHDRYVTDAATVIPGASSVTFMHSASSSIDLGPGPIGTLLSGPGGTIDDSTLDGGTFSNHGYAVASTLPAGSVIVLTRDNSSEVVDFYYSLGDGTVYYSTIPLDFYLDNSGGMSPEFQLYAANMAAYIFELLGPSLSSVQFQHIAMADASRFDTELLQKHIGSTQPGFFIDGGNYGFDRGKENSAQAFQSWDTGLLVGYTKGAGQPFAWTAALTLHDAGNKSTAINAVQAEYTSYGIKGVGRLALPEFMGISPWLDFIGGASVIDDVEMERATTTATTNGYQYDLGIQFGTELLAKEAVTIRPTIGLEYVSTHLDDFTESGDGAMSYGALDSQGAFATFGCAFALQPVTLNDFNIRSSFTMEYRQRLDQNNDDISVALVTTPADTGSLELFDYNQGMGKLELAVGVDYGLVSLDLTGSYYRGSDAASGTGLSLALSIPF